MGMRNLRPAQQLGREESGHHLYVVRIDFKSAGISRAAFMGALKQRGIGCQVHYVPVPMQPLYSSQGFDMGDLPNALAYYNQALSIPLYYDLSDSDQDHVIRTVKEFVN